MSSSITLNPSQLPAAPASSAIHAIEALSKLLEVISAIGLPTELLAWKPDLGFTPLTVNLQKKKASARSSGLGRFLGKFWSDDGSLTNAPNGGQRTSSIIEPDRVPGCTDLLAFFVGETASQEAVNMIAPPLLAVIDEEWRKAVARFSVRFGARWTVTAEDLEAFKSSADAFTQRLASFPGLILTHGLASVSALLAAVRPYVPIETGHNLHHLRESSAAGRILAMAFREAPAVIATNRASFDALRLLGVSRLHLLPVGLKEEREPEIRAQLSCIRSEVLSAKAENYSGFDSLCQKRMELPYEAASVEDYDSKYHGGTAYQIMDQKLVAIIAENLDRLHVTNPRILDLGCGPGSLVNQLRTIPGAQVTGVDLVPEMIRAAQERYPDVQFLVDDAESLSFPDGAFDVVLCSGMLHHLPTLTMAMHEILRVLKPNGIIVAREPNEDNFSARQPQLAYAHLCLRHYLFHALGTNPIVEPEAHKYHKSFTFDGFVEEMAKYAYVERLHTDLMVSYFYDEVITNPGDAERLARLDDTLAGQPGLNVVVVARKCDRKGVDPSVQNSVGRMKPLNLVSQDHYRALAEFGAEVFSQFPLDTDLFSSLVTHEPLKCLEKFAKPGKRVLLIGDDVDGLVVLKKECETGLKKLSATGNEILPFIQINSSESKGQELNRPFDHGMVLVQRSMPTFAMKKALDRISDYGWIYVELAPGATLTSNSIEEEQFLSSLPVAKALINQPGFCLKAAVSKLIHTERDFYKALTVALNIEIPRTRETARDGLAAILFESAGRFEQNPLGYSRNEQMNNKMSLLNLLSQSQKPSDANHS
jgi:ubiquinone/menaquinone biosynthesis C-methylase UbiE